MALQILSGLEIGTADVNLYRLSANHLKTDDNLTVAGTLTAGSYNVNEAMEGIHATHEPTGFPNETDSTITLVDNGANSTFSITPAVTSFDVWVGGHKFTKSVAQTLTIAHTTGVVYVYFNDAGTLVQSGDQWSFETDCPVAMIYRSNTAGDEILMDERHGLVMDWATHRYLHTTLGTKWLSGLVASGYTPNGTTDAHNTFAVSSGSMADEDEIHTISALADGGPYTVMWRTGASEWTWSTGNSVPLSVGGTYTNYNSVTGGVYGLTEMANNRWVNMWLFETSAHDAEFQHIVVLGQVSYTSLAAAQAASAASLVLGNFPFAEALLRYKFTYHTGGYSTTGKVRLEGVEEHLGESISIIGTVAPTSHTQLSNRDAADQHPAASITATPYGNLAGVTVQAQLNELEDEKAAITALGDYVPKIGTYAATTTDLVTSKVTGDAANRFVVNADGGLEWGGGAGATDVVLYRLGADTLYTADNFAAELSVGVGGGGLFGGGASTASNTIKLALNVSGDVANRFILDASGYMQWGDGTNAADTVLYRSAANTLATADRFAAAYTFDAMGGSTIYGLSSEPIFNPTVNEGTYALVAGWFRAYKANTAELTSTMGLRGVQASAYNTGTGPITSAAAFVGIVQNTGTATIGTAYGLHLMTPTADADSLITTSYGVYIAAQKTTGVTTGYGIWQAGTADTNYLGGHLGVGSSPSATYRISMSGTHTGTATGLGGVYSDFTVPSTATGTSSALYARPPTSAAAAFSMNYSIGVWVPGGAAAGADSTITRRFGLYMDPQTGATNNYTARLAASSTATLWLSADADNTTAAAGILFGSSQDTNLYRSAADTLKTDDAFTAGGNISLGAAGTLYSAISSTAAATWRWQSSVSGDAQIRHYVTADGTHGWGDGTNAADTNLFRSGANVLKTDDSLHVAGTLGVGVAPNANYLLYLGGNIPGAGTYTYGVIMQGYAPSTCTAGMLAACFRAGTAAASFTCGAAYGVYIDNPLVGSGSTITTAYGLYVVPQTSAGTNNFGVAIGASSTATLWLSNGADNTTAAAGIMFGQSRDTNLYRSGANELKTDDSLIVAGAKIELQSGYLGIDNTIYYTTIASKVTGDADDRWKATSEGVLYWGDGTNAVDTNLYRNGASKLKTDDDFEALSLTGTLDSSNIAWPASTGWVVSNKTADTTLDCNTVSLESLADNVGTLIDALIAAGIITAP